MTTASPVATDMMQCRLDAIALILDRYREARDRETLRSLTSRLEAMSYDLAIAAIESDRYFAGTEEGPMVWALIDALDRHVDRLERHCSDFPPTQLYAEVESAYFRALDVFSALRPRGESAATTT